LPRYLRTRVRALHDESTAGRPALTGRAVYIRATECVRARLEQARRKLAPAAAYRPQRPAGARNEGAAVATIGPEWRPQIVSPSICLPA